MSDPPGEPRESTQKQLSRALGTVWADHTGGKVGAVKAEIVGDRVKCQMDDEEAQSPDTFAYRTAVIATVTRVTGRRVVGFIPKRNKTTNVTTETFLLEAPRVVH